MDKIEKIEDLGWSAFSETERQKLELGDFPIARVTSESRGTYKVKNTNGEFLAKVTGKQMFEAQSREDYPAVGDWVAIEELDNNQAVIKYILPRKSVIKRMSGDKDKIGKKSDIQVIAANIDVAFIVQSVDRDYSINRFERYLAIIKEEGIKPIIIINKVDLISEQELDVKLSEAKNRLGDIETIPTSTTSGQGLEKLKNYIEKGRTYCFLGSSGVGKSSLINKLLGKNEIKTGDISSYSERGKHVTTKRKMYFLSSGGIVIDNPGIREVGITDSKEGISSLFSEIEVLAQKCKYADCTHTHEPGCEILAALEDGRLDKDRYSNYINLRKESGYYEMNKMEKRNKDRQFGKFIKKAKKDFNKFNIRNY